MFYCNKVINFECLFSEISSYYNYISILLNLKQSLCTKRIFSHSCVSKILKCLKARASDRVKRNEFLSWTLHSRNRSNTALVLFINWCSHIPFTRKFSPSQWVLKYLFWFDQPRKLHPKCTTKNACTNGKLATRLKIFSSQATFVDVFSATIGGWMSLCVGASIVAFGELYYFVGALLVELLFKKAPPT